MRMNILLNEYIVLHQRNLYSSYGLVRVYEIVKDR